MQNGADRQERGHGWICSTIGRKQLIGLTGAGLSLFVFIHMLENMLILVGPRVYNEYVRLLNSTALVYVAEAGLLAIFLGHLLFALRISWSNYRARDSRYAMMSRGAKRTSPIQRSLWAQGLLILVFVVLHLATFKYGAVYTVNYGQGEMRDLHRLVVEVFQDPGYVAWYIVALVVLGFHLSHGVGSVFQTLGIHHPRYQKYIRAFSLLYALIVTAGFIVEPVYVYFIR